jgi:serine/threonine protein kinase
MDPTVNRLIHSNCTYRTDYDDQKSDKYKIVRKLQRGSEGVAILIQGKTSGRQMVYKVRETRRPKVLPREVVTRWDLLQHNVHLDRGVSLVKVIDFWFSRPTENVMLMEYCEEGDLAGFVEQQLQKTKGALSTRKLYKLPNYFIAHVMIHLINGLVYLHTGNEWDFSHKLEWKQPAHDWPGTIVHKDITLTNIFIRNTRRTRRAHDWFDLPEFCIGDLGLACPLNKDHQHALEFREDLPDDVFLEPFKPESLGNPY